MIHAQPVADVQARIDGNGILLAAILSEVSETATQPQERAFLLAAGKRIAESYPLTDIIELNALESRMNEVWHLLDLGNVHLFLDKDGIGIEHRRSAVRCAIGDEQWDKAEPIVIEAIYGCWFATMGSDRLSLRPVGQSYDKISFHYGR